MFGRLFAAGGASACCWRDVDVSGLRGKIGVRRGQDRGVLTARAAVAGRSAGAAAVTLHFDGLGLVGGVGFEDWKIVC